MFGSEKTQAQAPGTSVAPDYWRFIGQGWGTLPRYLGPEQRRLSSQASEW